MTKQESPDPLVRIDAVVPNKRPLNQTFVGVATPYICPICPQGKMCHQKITIEIFPDTPAVVEFCNPFFLTKPQCVNLKGNVIEKLHSTRTTPSLSRICIGRGRRTQGRLKVPPQGCFSPQKASHVRPVSFFPSTTTGLALHSLRVLVSDPYPSAHGV